MKKRLGLAVVACILLSGLICVQVQADVPSYIEYEFELAKKSKKGEHTLVFSLWTDEESAGKLWEELHIIDIGDNYDCKGKSPSLP